MTGSVQHTFSNKDVLECLVRKAGIKDGKWMMAVNFTFTAGNAGPSPDQVMPSAIIGLQSVLIQRAAADSPECLVIDAGTLDPYR